MSVRSVTEHSVPVCIHHLFEERALSYPSNVAIDMMGNYLTYGQVHPTTLTSHPFERLMFASGPQVILCRRETVDTEGTGSRHCRWNRYRRGRLYDSGSACCSHGWCGICSRGHEPAATVMSIDLI
jgi:hypothetical protein